MARQCRKCGKKISFGEKNVHLVYSDIYFCAACGVEVNDLLNPVRIVSDKEKLEIRRVEFKKYLNSSTFNKEIQDYIRDEFEYIAGDHVFNIVEPDELGSDPMVAKHFKIAFEDCYDIIEEYGSKFGINKVKTKVIDPGDVRVTTFVFYVFTVMGSNSYVTLVVNLLYFRGITTVTTICSEPYSFSDSASSVLRNFWIGIRQNYPEFMKLMLEEEEFIAMDDVEDSREIQEGSLISTGIGVFGGTFDPIHKGHVALGEAAVRELVLKKLIIMPARVQPFKAGKRVTEDYHREAMARLAFDGNDKVEVSDYELNNLGISYTYQTLRYIREKYPEEKMYFILGTDSFLELESWYRGVELLERYAFAVSVRPDYEESALNQVIEKYKSKYGTEVVKLKSKMPRISSTEIRERFSLGQSASDLLPEAVERYIHKNGLYR